MNFSTACWLPRKASKDIPDDKFQEVVDYINFLKENPS